MSSANKCPELGQFRRRRPLHDLSSFLSEFRQIRSTSSKCGRFRPIWCEFRQIRFDFSHFHKLALNWCWPPSCSSPPTRNAIVKLRPCGKSPLACDRKFGLSPPRRTQPSMRSEGTSFKVAIVKDDGGKLVTVACHGKESITCRRALFILPIESTLRKAAVWGVVCPRCSFVRASGASQGSDRGYY